jgi:hypothetical protein
MPENSLTITCDRCGAASIAESVTILAKPGYTLVDLMLNINCPNCGKRSQPAPPDLCHDRLAKIAVGLLASTGAFLTAIDFAKPGTGWDYFSLVTAVAAGVAGIVLNVLPFSEWVNRHTELFQRWTDYREDVDDLLHDFNEEITPVLASAAHDPDGIADSFQQSR